MTTGCLFLYANTFCCDIPYLSLLTMPLPTFAFILQPYLNSVSTLSYIRGHAFNHNFPTATFFCETLPITLPS